MLHAFLTVDKGQVRGIQRDFYNVHNVLSREVPLAINRVTEMSRLYIAKRMAGANPGLTKKEIHSATTTEKARPSTWEGKVLMSGPRVPVAKLDVRLGTQTETTKIASEKQSAWLFYNVFKRKYGAAAVFSTAYQIARKSFENITYRVNGRTRSLAGTGAFPINAGLRLEGIFKRAGDKVREIKGPSLFQILDGNTVMMRDITRDLTKGFEDQLESMLDGRGVDLIPRVPIERLTDAGVR